MSVTYKDIDLLTQKTASDGTEKFPVSDTQYLTPPQIVIGGSAKTTLTPIETVTGSFIRSNGTVVTNSAMSYSKYAVTPGKTYLFSGRFNQGMTTDVYFIFWYNASGTLISHESYHANGSTNVIYEDQPIVAPSGAAFLVQNIQTSQTTYVPSVVKAVGDIIPTALAELRDDSTHRVVTDTEKSTWNGKSNFSGSYNDLTDKPTIPNITISSSEPTAQDGSDGDIWIVV